MVFWPLQGLFEMYLLKLSSILFIFLHLGVLWKSLYSF